MAAGGGKGTDARSVTSGSGDGEVGRAMPISLTYTRYSNTPSKVPWGLPPGIKCFFDCFPLYLRIMLLFVRYETRILKIHPGTPQSDSLMITLLWSILLKALEKSIKAIMTAFGMDEESVLVRMKLNSEMR